MARPRKSNSSNKDAIAIDGVRELVRAITKINPDLRKELGQRNKAIGQSIIDKAFPKPEKVGEGSGALPRASATANVLRIMAGGSHRKQVQMPDGKGWVQQWGRRPKSRGGVARPFIRRSAEVQMPDIQKKYLDAMAEVASKAGLKMRKS